MCSLNMSRQSIKPSKTFLGFLALMISTMLNPYGTLGIPVGMQDTGVSMYWTCSTWDRMLVKTSANVHTAVRAVVLYDGSTLRRLMQPSRMVSRSCMTNSSRSDSPIGRRQHNFEAHSSTRAVWTGAQRSTYSTSVVSGGAVMARSTKKLQSCKTLTRKQKLPQIISVSHVAFAHDMRHDWATTLLLRIGHVSKQLMMRLRHICVTVLAWHGSGQNIMAITCKHNDTHVYFCVGSTNAIHVYEYMFTPSCYCNKITLPSICRHA